MFSDAETQQKEKNQYVIIKACRDYRDILLFIENQIRKLAPICKIRCKTIFDDENNEGFYSENQVSYIFNPV